MKNNYRSIMALIISGISVVLAILILVFDYSKLVNAHKETILIVISVPLISLLLTLYISLVFKRITPKINIFISYSTKDQNFESQFSAILESNLSKFSKRRYQLLSIDTIPYGENIADTICEYIIESDYAIILLSSNYTQSSLTLKELSIAYQSGIPLIPVLLSPQIENFPSELSNLKTLVINDINSTEDLNSQISLLAKDISRRRLEV